jgi:CubicO group peptidase (beta-lactamase class C family)
MRTLAAVVLGATLVSQPARPPSAAPRSAAPPSSAPRTPSAQPAHGLDAARLDAITPVIEQAIAEKKLPGAVVLVGRGDRVVWQQAIGRRAVEPAS